MVRSVQQNDVIPIEQYPSWVAQGRSFEFGSCNDAVADDASLNMIVIVPNDLTKKVWFLPDGGAEAASTVEIFESPTYVLTGSTELTSVCLNRNIACSHGLTAWIVPTADISATGTQLSKKYIGTTGIAQTRGAADASFSEYLAGNNKAYLFRMTNKSGGASGLKVCTSFIIEDVS